MAGVSLVGFSGSLIKDAVKEIVVNTVRSTSLSLSASEPTEKPEATKALIGELSLPNRVFYSKAHPCLGVFFILFAQVL